MPTRKEDNEDERQARVDAMLEEHRKLIQRADHAQVTVRLAQVRARMAQVLAFESRESKQRRRAR
jgi:hypothetical protein